MKDWILGRRLMAEAGGEGGGGGGAGGGEGGAGGSGGGEAPKGDENNGGGTGGEGGEGGAGEQRPNALGEEANKPGGEGEQQPGDKPKGGERPGDKPAEPDPNAPTEEELKAYAEAMKLDEKEFGKDGKLAEGYASRLPAFFKKHGVAPDKVNAMTSDFVRMQKEIDKDAIAKAVARNAELDALTEKRNKDFYVNYDAAARTDIINGFKWCFPERSVFREILSTGPAGMDPDILRICQFVGQRLAKDKAPGAAAGAGAGGSKSISDSFMGV